MRSLRWRVILGLCLGGLATLLILLFLVTRDFGFLAKWGVEGALPGVTFSAGSVKLTGTGELTASNLVMQDLKTREVLISMSRGIVRFRPHDLINRRLSEVILEQPALFISQSFVRLFSSNRKEGLKASDSKKFLDWQIDVFRCDYGELFMQMVDNPAAYLYSRFCFDLQELGVGDSRSARLHEITFWGAGVSLSPDFQDLVLAIDLAQVEFNFKGLLEEQQINSVHIKGGDLHIGEAEQQLTNLFGSHSKDSDERPWVIGALNIHDIRTHVQDSRPEVAGITLELNTKFANLPLGNIAEAIGSEQQMIELANVEIVSPIDPLMRILTLRSVFVKFTLAGIGHKEIQEIVIVSPTIYLTQDLFTYMREMREATGAETTKGNTSETSWIIRQLRVALGRLVLGGERIGEIGLPLEFRTLAHDVAFDNLASLQLKAVLEVRNESYDFVELQLSLENLYGNLRFAYPPEKALNNLVNVLYLDQLRWRQFEATDLWLSATFEEAGISAEFGGRLYEGYFNAGVAFSFGGESRWVGWVTGSNIDLNSVTTVLAPENVTLTSPADFRVEVDASGQIIERLIGEMKATKPGHMEITKLDEVMKRIPGDWSALKKSSTRIALETLRDYDYDSAKATFWFVNKQGKLNLSLTGPTGHRDFEAVLQETGTEKRKWNE